jgi:uncharacterized protein (TIGR03066 family)
MNVLARVGLGLAVMVLAGLARAEDKKEFDKAKLIGTWKVTKAEGAPEGALVEFTKDGKFIVTFEVNGEKKSVDGTYKLEGDKLHTVMKIGDMEMKDTDTIKSLTDDKLNLIDKDGKPAELEKVKKK